MLAFPWFDFYYRILQIAGRDEFEWTEGPGVNVSHAYREDVRLVVANKGKDSAGFSVCESCGGAWVDGEEPAGPHARPFLVHRHILERDGARSRCSGDICRGLFLVHSFRTDLLLLRGAIRRPLDYQPKQPWLNDALATLAEALALGASLDLDIDPGELSAGFRLLPPLVEGDYGVAEIYLFDTASGGAGYAADAGTQLQKVLDKTEKLLRECPANCERSCTKCLRHYGNRLLHGRLDRRLALQLLRYFRNGEIPPFASATEQARVLRPLGRFLELEGWTTTVDSTGALNCGGPRAMTVGVYPVLLASDAAETNHPTAVRLECARVLLPGYLVEQDLPSAYQRLMGLSPVPSSTSPRSPNSPHSDGRVVELPISDLRKAAEIKAHGKVRLMTNITLPEDAFAVRVPNPGLMSVGFGAGEWLIVRPVSPADLGPDLWLVVLRAHGNFGATGSDWTIAHVKEIAGDEGTPSRLQVSYSATSKEFRPERLEREQLNLAATIICHADEPS